MSNAKVYLLTGDIGGTNSRLSLYETISHCGSDDSALVKKTFRNADEFTNDDGHEIDPGVFARKILSPFIKYCIEEQEDVKIRQDCLILATLASAGVVNGNRVRLTNLGHGLLIDGDAIALNSTDPYISKVFHCKVINDFVAVRVYLFLRLINFRFLHTILIVFLARLRMLNFDKSRRNAFVWPIGLGQPASWSQGMYWGGNRTGRMLFNPRYGVW